MGSQEVGLASTAGVIFGEVSLFGGGVGVFRKTTGCGQGCSTASEDVSDAEGVSGMVKPVTDRARLIAARNRGVPVRSPTVRKWRGRFRRKAPDGLPDRSSRPRRPPARTCIGQPPRCSACESGLGVRPRINGKPNASTAPCSKNGPTSSSGLRNNSATKPANIHCNNHRRPRVALGWATPIETLQALHRGQPTRAEQLGKAWLFTVTVMPWGGANSRRRVSCTSPLTFTRTSDILVLLPWLV